jgi:hypothetical protein
MRLVTFDPQTIEPAMFLLAFSANMDDISVSQVSTRFQNHQQFMSSFFDMRGKIRKQGLK